MGYIAWRLRFWFSTIGDFGYMVSGCFLGLVGVVCFWCLLVWVKFGGLCIRRVLVAGDCGLVICLDYVDWLLWG